MSDALRLLLGFVVLGLAALPVRPDTVGRVERDIFDVVNGLPDWLYVVLWAPMQLGAFPAVLVAAAAAFVWCRRDLAMGLAFSGTVAWLLAHVIKDWIGRPRPSGLVEGVVIRGHEAAGFGFVSGHTAVAFALATTAALHLPRRWRWRLYAVAVVVGIARIFVGAHLPLDVLGGGGLGLAVASGCRFVVTAPDERPCARSRGGDSNP